MAKDISMKPKIEDLPELINRAYPNSQNMNGIAERLKKDYSKIFPYIGQGSVFMKNHFKHKFLEPDGGQELNSANLDFFNPLMEGLWHLHVAWSLLQAGFTLVVPEHDDDVVIELNNQRIAFEVTLSDVEVGYITRLSNEAITKKMLAVAKKKDKKIRNRASGIPTVIVLNEQRVINDGFRLYGSQGSEYTHRLERLNNLLQAAKLNDSLGVIYSNIKYGDFFAKNIYPTPVLVKGVLLNLEVS